MGKRRRTTAVVAALAAVAVFAAACGDDEPAPGPSAGGADSSAALAEAEALVEESLQNPASIIIDTPLSAKPRSDIYLISVETPVPVTAVRNDAMGKAAELLGWRYERIVPGSGPEDFPNAFTQALAKQPDAIHISGVPFSVLQSQLAAAEEQGVVVISDSVGGPAEGPVISNALDGDEQVAAWGKMVASYVAVESGGDANVAMFTVKDFPILGVFVDSFRETLAAACPDCGFTEVNQQLADIGTETPSSVVSTLQKDPEINWAIFSFGDLSLGVPAALKGAGLDERVNIGGETPTQANLEAVRAGTESVWTGFTAPILGWRVVDVLARHFVGDDVAAAEQVLMPTQLITADNVEDLVLDSTGYYVGVDGYQDAFEELWLVE